MPRFGRSERLVVAASLTLAIGTATGLLLLNRRNLGKPDGSGIAAATRAVDFHRELADVGFDGARAAGAFRPLVWPRPVRSETDVMELIQTVDLSPAAIAVGPHVDMVSIQSSLKVLAPVLNSIAAFSNAQTDLWILRQRNMSGDGYWRTYGIAQDKSVSPNTAIFFELTRDGIRFTGTSGGVSCYECHASGPRAIRPLRPDLVNTPSTATAFNERIATNGLVQLHVPAAELLPDLGEPLSASACLECHSLGGERAPLYHLQAESVRSLIAIGAMPKDHRLSAIEVGEIESWLRAK